MPKWNGGVIGVANNPTQSSAKGIWSLSEATKAIRAGLWPPSNAGADPYFENVTLLLPGDGTNGAQNNTFLDSSTNNFTITRNGNTTQGTFTPFSKVNGRWGVSLNGSDAAFSVNVSGISAGTSTFTLEFWVYLNAYPASDAPFVDTRSSNGATTTAFQFGVYSTGAIKFYDGTETNLGGTVPKGQWAHIALVRNGSNVVTVYINGTATGTTVSSTRNFSDNYFWIASIPGPASPYLNGFLSNLRWVVGSSVYTSNFTAPTAPLTDITNTKLLTFQSNRFVDNNTQVSAKTITVNGSPQITTFSPFPTLTAYAAGTNGGSGYFDGTGDQLVTPSNAALGMSTGDFTIELWYYQLSRGSGHTILAPSTDNLNIYITTGGVLGYYNGATQDSSQTIPLNAWGHIAVVRSSGTLKIYYNGVQVLSQANSINYGTASWYIGTNPAGIGASFGYITDARIVKGTAVYTAAFTPPTAPLTAITNTSLLLSGTNGGIIDTSMSNDLETVGNAQISTTQSKFGGASMYFDGSGDYLFVPNTNLSFNFGTGDFTVEGWIYLSATPSTAGTIIDTRSSDALSEYFICVTTSNKLDFIYSSSRVTSATSISNTTWTHFAITRSSGTIRLFINGTLDANTASYSGGINAAATPAIGGGRAGGTSAINGYYLNGYIDDLRITKGYARYTASFTAPVGPFNGFGD